jgi:hypothetical protein
VIKDPWMIFAVGWGGRRLDHSSVSEMIMFGSRHFEAGVTADSHCELWINVETIARGRLSLVQLSAALIKTSDQRVGSCQLRITGRSSKCSTT